MSAPITNNMGSVLNVLFSLFIVALLMSGIVDFITNFEENNCEMTYMFEVPEYIKVPLGKNSQYSQYKLYIYGEGFYAREMSKLKLTGIPVLFIPGNAGSYRQVRSLGSVALRMAKDRNSKNHFNYFTVDLNEEFAGLHGGVLQQQTEFVHHCLNKILLLYKDAHHPPKSVLLVGHSLGGIVARALFTLPTFDPQTVHTIITQATPHQMPVISLDGILAEFYQRVNAFWRSHSNTSLSHVTVLSTGGGFRDILVRNDLTSLDGLIDPALGVSSSTVSVPRAWVSTDHLCAVWCRQIVLATKRAIFDIIDPETKQISEDVNLKMAVFRHHFVSHSGTKKFVTSFPGQLPLDASAVWTMKEENIWVFSQIRVPSPRYFVVPVQRSKMDTFIAISNVHTDNWICACKLREGEDRCSSCVNLSDKGKMIPPLYAGKKTVELSMDELEDMTHIVLLVPSTSAKVEIMAEWHIETERHLGYQLPGMFDLLITFPDSIFGAGTVLHLQNGTLHHRLKLRGYTGVLKTYKAILEPRFCMKTSNDAHEGSMMSIHVPWGHEDSYSFSRLGENNNLSLKLQSGKADDMSGDVELDLFLHPSCWYLLKIAATPLDMGQFIRFYGFQLPAFLVSIILLAFVGQLNSFRQTTNFPHIVPAISDYIQPWKLAPVVILITTLLQFSVPQQLLKSIDLLDDGDAMRKNGLWFNFLPFLLFIFSINVTKIQVTLYSFGINNMSRLAGKLFTCLPESVHRLGRIVELVMCAVALLASVSMCGSLGILICHILLYVKVLWTCYLSRKTNDEEMISKYNFYQTLFFLWMWILVMNSVPLFLWLKNLQHSLFGLTIPDPSLPVSVICCSALTVILYLDNPAAGRPGYGVVCVLTYGLTILMVMYGMVSVYRIPYFITVVLILVATSQIIYTYILSSETKTKSD